MPTNSDHTIMLTDREVLLLGSLLLGLLLFFLRRVQQVKKTWQPFENLPAQSVFISPIGIVGRFFPRIPWISAGADFNWRNVYESQLPFQTTGFLLSSRSLSRRLRSIQVRCRSTPVTVPGQYPTTATRRCHSY